MTIATTKGHCISCVHFRNDPAFLERTFAGLTSLSSGYGSTRGDDGICLLHGRYLSASAFCIKFSNSRVAGAAAPTTAVGDTSLIIMAKQAIERMLIV